MGTRGRKSAAELSIVGNTGTQVVRRPSAPKDLTTEQAHEWRQVVNSLPADQYGAEMHSILAAYCRHAVSQRHIGQLIEKCESADEFNIRDYDRLLKMQERESRCMASLAVRLGIAKTTAHAGTSKPQSTPNPWEFDG